MLFVEKLRYHNYLVANYHFSLDLFASTMYTSVFLLCFVPLVLGGYLPPQDNNYSYNSCSCDSQISELAARLDRLEGRNSGYINRSKRQYSGGPIAFTAYLSNYKYNLQIGSAVVFDTTLTNEGNAYDVTTGKFMAPVYGLYMFSFIIESKHNVDTAVQLVVDGVNALDAVVEPRQNEQNLQGGNVGVLKLQPGQKVWVKVYNSGHQSIEGGDTYRFTTFTGVLLTELEMVNSASGVGK